MIPRDPNTEPAAEEELELEEPEALKQALAEERERAENYLASWQRAQADFVNYKRRNEQEKGEIGRFAKAELMQTLLPVLDDLERALGSITPRLAKMDWVEGIRLIERKLRSGLEAQGLSEIKALGEAFDPNLHEAAIYQPGEEGIVIAEIRKGYMLHDRVVRPSMVVVGNGEKEQEEAGQAKDS